MAGSARRPIVAGNWKMHKTVAESLALVGELKALAKAVSGPVEVVVAPPFTALYPVIQAVAGTGLKVAAQNVYWEPAGAFTGEVSAPQLAELGCAYVIVGHSERRQFFGETDETVNKRVHAVLKAGLAPIVCIGETLAERESGETNKVVQRQLRGGLAGLEPAQASKLVLAYEPVWAIGTGRTATSEQAQETHAAIRGTLSQLFGAEVAGLLRIQYGGSVKPDNAADLLSRSDVDGALVGGASLKAADFAAIVNAAG